MAKAKTAPAAKASQKISYVDMVAKACESNGNKFTSRAAIKTYLSANFGFNGSALQKANLKKALAKFEKKGDKFRKPKNMGINKEAIAAKKAKMAEKKAASKAKLIAKREAAKAKKAAKKAALAAKRQAKKEKAAASKAKKLAAKKAKKSIHK